MLSKVCQSNCITKTNKTIKNVARKGTKNVFKMYFSDFLVALKDCPLDVVRNEKELPTAIGRWVMENPRKMISIPFEGGFLDLTHPSDFLFVTNKLQ